MDTGSRLKTCIPVSSTQKMPHPRASGDEIQKQLNREQRQKQYAKVQYFKHKGYSQRRIARLLNLSRGTVRTFYTATEYPERKPVSQFSTLDPFLDYFHARVKTREATAKQLWQEIAEQGYRGSYRQVGKWVTAFNKQQGRKTDAFPTGRLPGRDIYLKLLTCQPETLTNEDAYLLGVLLEISVLQQLYTLVQEFATMVRQHNVQAFDPWLRSCETSSIQACQLFAQSLTRGYDAVRAALSTDWSNGQTEGQIHRLKLLKRQIYGRANLDLLRIRVCYKP